MLDAATAAFLEGGCALIVGVVSPDGAPYATRGWGLTVLPGEVTSVRLLLAADDTPALEHLGDGGRVAITAADVPTLRSVQLKGCSVALEAAADEDRARAVRYIEAFFTDIVETDGTPRRIVDRLAPVDFAACTVAVDELYDQTPGPSAGAPMPGTGS